MRRWRRRRRRGGLLLCLLARHCDPLVSCPFSSPVSSLCTSVHGPHGLDSCSHRFWLRFDAIRCDSQDSNRRLRRAQSASVEDDRDRPSQSQPQHNRPQQQEQHATPTRVELDSGQARERQQDAADRTPQPSCDRLPIAAYRHLQPQRQRTTKGGERARSKLICTQHNREHCVLPRLSRSYKCI